MPYTAVPVYLCNPKNMKIKRRIFKMIEAAEFLGCSRQAVADSCNTGRCVCGYIAVRKDEYDASLISKGK